MEKAPYEGYPPYTLIAPGCREFVAFGVPPEAGEVCGGFIVDRVEGRRCWLRPPESEREQRCYEAWLAAPRDGATY